MKHESLSLFVMTVICKIEPENLTSPVLTLIKRKVFLDKV